MREREKKSRSLAKTLRRGMTRAEVRLWARLRRKQMHGRRFRRQHPIGPYIADFACVEAYVVIEVDGETHSTDEEQSHDQARDAYLRKNGWTVIRVWNADIYRNLNGVLDLICSAIPPPPPSAAPPP